MRLPVKWPPRLAICIKINGRRPATLIISCLPRLQESIGLRHPLCVEKYHQRKLPPTKLFGRTPRKAVVSSRDSGLPEGYSTLPGATVVSWVSSPPAALRFVIGAKHAFHVDLDTFSSNLGTSMPCQNPVWCSIRKVVGYAHLDRPSGIGVSAFLRNSPLRTVSGNILIIFLVPSLISAIYRYVISCQSATTIAIVSESGCASRIFFTVARSHILSSLRRTPKKRHHTSTCCLEQRVETQALSVAWRATHTFDPQW